MPVVRQITYKHATLRVTFEDDGTLDTIEYRDPGNLLSSKSYLAKAVLRYADDLFGCYLPPRALAYGFRWARSNEYMKEKA